MVEKILGHVIEDDVTRRPDPLERPERDEPVAGADVEYDVSCGYLGVVEDAITHGGEVFELSPQQFGVATVPTAQEPLRPLVEDLRRHGGRFVPPLIGRIPAGVRELDTGRLDTEDLLLLLRELIVGE